MKIEYLMEEIISNNMTTDGIKDNEELYYLNTYMLQKMPENIAVTDDSNKIVGEIKKSFLEKILLTNPLEYIASILDFLPTGIVAINTEGIIIYANEEYSKLIGKPLREIIGNNINNLTANSAILTSTKTGEKIIMKKRYLETIGKDVSGMIYPIYIKGQLKGAVSIFSDTSIDELQNRVKEVSSEVIYLRQKLQNANQNEPTNIVGQSNTFLHLIEKASIVAETDVPVLIRGENGVGKEVLARYIHSKSLRANKPFIVVNCAAIPDNLIESELFGYEGGSFTGAKMKGKIGKFELANEGTLFLDEIGDMPIMMQTKLLRALQDKEIEKIGSERMISVDVRFIAATNQPLEDMIFKKTFRSDLYYRINTVTLAVPALRYRKEDVVLFLNYFLKETNKKYNKNVRLTDEVFATLCHYEWPGNVRELKNFIENAVIMCNDDYYDKDSMLEYFGGTLKNSGNSVVDLTVNDTYVPMTLHQALAEAERKILRNALKAHNNNRTDTMNALGLSRRTFYRKLNEYGLL